MDLIADILLASGALGAAFYCFVLSRRLSKFNDLENGVGGAVAVLSAQVDDLTKALDRARHGADRETEKLEDLTARAEAAAQQLELMMASMHDLPETAGEAGAARPATPAPQRRTGPPADLDPATEPARTPSAPVFSRAGRRA